MITEYSTKEIKLNTELKDHKKGDIVKIKTNKEGTPLDPYWRAREKDAKIDHCISEVQTEESQTEENQTEEE